MLKIAFLAFLQGVAEFLPISSSGHLVISQHFLGVHIDGLRLDIALHVGTLMSIAVFYRVQLGHILMNCFSPRVSDIDRREAWLFVLKILISSMPAILVYFLLKDYIEGFFEDARIVGAFLIFTGIILITTRFLPKGTKGVSFFKALFMGLAQAFALLPGVSRSGMTLASARMSAVESEKAAEFSFLMSAPLILGALVLEIIKSFGECEASAAAQVSWPMLIFGMIVAAIVGYFSLKILVKALKGKWFWLFGPYCILAGIMTMLFV